jgi:hypothetical protein
MENDIDDKIFGIIFCTIAFFVVVNFIEIAKHNYKHNKEMKRKQNKKN